MSLPLPRLAATLGHEISDKRIEILRRIAEAGSISEAARAAGVSYKAAWQAIETLGNLAGTSLVDKAVGGAGGGGAVLTEAGRRVLEAAERLAEARGRVLANLENGQPMPAPFELAALGLRTSMRNLLPCQVATLVADDHGVRVGLALAGDLLLHARITAESAQLLGLQPGLQVHALCKAAAVRIGHRAAAGHGNLLPGIVTEAPAVELAGEVGLRLASGLQLTGFAAADHGLEPDMQATAHVDEAAMVVAVTG